MSQVTCEKCGELLEGTALTCWACGTLTAAGRKAKGESAENDEVWRRSVEAARARQTQAPAVDPDEALKRVLAQTGAPEHTPHVPPRPAGIPAVEHRTDYMRLRDEASTTSTLGLLLAVVFALAGVLLVVVAILSQAGPLASIAGVAALLLFGGLSVTTHYVFRNMASMMTTVADAAESARRALALLRDYHSSTDKQP
ncbi:MAG: hypothetical protein ABFD96_01510 [Armatimonadia bacterium]